MPGRTCAVSGCSSRSGRRPTGPDSKALRFFRIPKWKQREGSLVSDVTRRRRMAWLAALQRKDITFNSTYPFLVCSLHFHAGQPSYEMLENHPDWKPSLRLGHGEVPATDEARFQRLQKRSVSKVSRLQGQTVASPPPPQDQAPPPPPPQPHQDQAPPPQPHQDQAPPPQPHQDQAPPPQPHQDQAPPPQPHQDQAPPPPAPDREERGCAFCQRRQDTINSLLEENRELKEELERHKLNENFLKGDDDKVSYYTGLPNFLVFQVLITRVLPFGPQGQRTLSAFQCVLLTFMRLRLDLPVEHLSHLFRVHRSTVSAAFQQTLGVLYSRLSPLVCWPSRPCLKVSMPHQFVEAFGDHAAVIVDCFEVSAERPSNLPAREQTVSHRRDNHTLKYLIVMTPQGFISFTSKGWGGRTSDKRIAEECGFLEKLSPGDVVLADRGFNIRDGVGMMCAEVKSPSYATGRAQLHVKDADETGAVAHLRDHVEKAIGVVRNKYRMLNSVVPADMLLPCEGEDVTGLDKVIAVCCAVTNICPSVV